MTRTEVWTSRLRLYPDIFFDMETFVPPIEEQQIIASYLDHKTAAITALIEKKEKMLSLLYEKKVGLIDQADSRLVHLMQRIERPVNRDNVEVYRPIGLRSFSQGTFKKEPLNGADLGDSNFFWVKKGDFIFSGPFSWEGAVAIARSSDADCVVSHRFPIFKCNRELVEPYYFLAFFQTPRGRFLLSENSNGAAGRNRPLNINTLMEECIVVATHNSIQILKEYRTALISAAVTSKIDVRKEVA